MGQFRMIPGVPQWACQAPRIVRCQVAQVVTGVGLPGWQPMNKENMTDCCRTQ